VLEILKDPAVTASLAILLLAAVAQYICYRMFKKNKED